MDRTRVRPIFFDNNIRRRASARANISLQP